MFTMPRRCSLHGKCEQVLALLAKFKPVADLWENCESEAGL